MNRAVEIGGYGHQRHKRPPVRMMQFCPMRDAAGIAEHAPSSVGEHTHNALIAEMVPGGSVRPTAPSTLTSTPETTQSDHVPEMR